MDINGLSILINGIVDMKKGYVMIKTVFVFLLVSLLASCEPEEVTFNRIELAPHRWDAIKSYLEQKGFSAVEPKEDQIKDLLGFFISLEKGKLYWSYAENKILLIYVSPDEETAGERDIVYYPRTNKSGNLVDEYYQSNSAPRGGWKDFGDNLWSGFRNRVQSVYDNWSMDLKYESVIREFDVWFKESEDNEDRIYWLKDPSGYMVVSNGTKNDFLVFDTSQSANELFSLIPQFEYQRVTALDFNGFLYGYLLGLLPEWIIAADILSENEIQSFTQDHLQIIRDFEIGMKGYQVTTYHKGQDGSEYRCDSFFSPYQDKRTDVIIGVKK
jgi:hypothetical protein